MIISNNRFKRMFASIFAYYDRRHAEWRQPATLVTGCRRESRHYAIRLQRARLRQQHPEQPESWIEDQTRLPGKLISRGG